MTTVITNLRARQKALLAQLGVTEDLAVRERLEYQLEQINIALELLDSPESPRHQS